MIQSIRFDFGKNRVFYVDENGQLNSFRDKNLRSVYEKILEISGIEVLEEHFSCFDISEIDPEDALI